MPLELGEALVDAYQEEVLQTEKRGQIWARLMVSSLRGLQPEDLMNKTCPATWLSGHHLRCPFPNHVNDLVALDRSPGPVEGPKPLLGVDPPCHGRVVLLNDIVQVRAGGTPAPAPQVPLLLQCRDHLRIAADIDHSGARMIHRGQGLAEELPGGSRIPLLRQREINGGASRVHRSVQIGPFPGHPDIRLIQAPGVTDQFQVRVPKVWLRTSDLFSMNCGRPEILAMRYCSGRIEVQGAGRWAIAAPSGARRPEPVALPSSTAFLPPSAERSSSKRARYAGAFSFSGQPQPGSVMVNEPTKPAAGRKSKHLKGFKCHHTSGMGAQFQFSLDPGSQHRAVAVHPAPDRRVVDAEVAFRHRLFQVAVGAAVAQVQRTQRTLIWWAKWLAQNSAGCFLREITSTCQSRPPPPATHPCGVVIREPQSLSDRLSEELEARLPEIIRTTAIAEFTGAEAGDPAGHTQKKLGVGETPG